MRLSIGVAPRVLATEWSSVPWPLNPLRDGTVSCDSHVVAVKNPPTLTALIHSFDFVEISALAMKCCTSDFRKMPALGQKRTLFTKEPRAGGELASTDQGRESQQ
jgi:hypothetical protein